jgi:hypothetical protein
MELCSKCDRRKANKACVDALCYDCCKKEENGCRLKSHKVDRQTRIEETNNKTNKKKSQWGKESTELVDIPNILKAEDLEIIRFVDQLFKGIVEPIKLSKREEIATNMACERTLDGFGSATYGEIAQKSIPGMISLLQLQSADKFYDLGCGVGRAVIHVALKVQCPSLGIEISNSR